MDDKQNMITITVGDDSNALSQDIFIDFDTELDLTGFYAIFELQGLQWRFNDITSKHCELIITREQSAQLKPGTCKAGLKVYDNKGLARTILRDIPVLINSLVVWNGRMTEIGGANE